MRFADRAVKNKTKKNNNNKKVNCGYVVITVSLAETLRSTEPVITVVLALLFLRNEPVSNLVLLSFFPLVVGGCMSSFGDATFTWTGFMFVMVSNVCFSTRSLFTKQLKMEYNGNAINVFYHISRLGAICLFLLFLFLQTLYFVMLGNYSWTVFSDYNVALGGPGSSESLVEVFVFDSVFCISKNL